MKTSKMFAVALAAMVVAASGAFAALLPGGAVPSDVSGTVEVIKDGKWVALKSGAALNAGDVVRTAKKSGVTLALTTGAIVKMLENSELALAVLNRTAVGVGSTAKTDTKVALKKGAVLVKFGAPASGSVIAVETAVGIVSADVAADFAAALSDECVEFHALAGTVTVAGLKGAAVTGKNVLKAGDMALVCLNKDTKVEKIPEGNNLLQVYAQFNTAAQPLAVVLAGNSSVVDVVALVEPTVTTTVPGQPAVTQTEDAPIPLPEISVEPQPFVPSPGDKREVSTVVPVQ